MYSLQCFCVTLLMESDVYLALNLRINFRPVNTSSVLLLVYIVTVIRILRSAVPLLLSLRVIYVSSAATTIRPGKCYPCWTLHTDVLYVHLPKHKVSLFVVILLSAARYGSHHCCCRCRCLHYENDVTAH